MVCCSALCCVKKDICHPIFTYQFVVVCETVCCSVLRCVALCQPRCLSSHVDLSVCCGVFCSVLQYVAVCCSALQCALQRVAVRCMVSTQMFVTPCRLISVWQYVAVCFAVCCSVLQHVAACCSVLQCVALYQNRCLSPHVDSMTSVRLFCKGLFCKRALPKYTSFAKEPCSTFD